MLAILLSFIGSIYNNFDNTHFSTRFTPFANFIREQTKPEERIFVWGNTPTIYWESDRLPATRFFNSSHLSGRGVGLPRSEVMRLKNRKQLILPGAWPLLMEDLNKHPPAYILDMAPTGLDGYKGFEITNYPLLMNFVRAHYVQESSFKGASVFRRIS